LNLGWCLFWQGEFELMKQDLDISFGLGMASEADFTSVGGGKGGIKQLDGGGFL
jgi:hypothetical protein